jgi:hypothetical protein
MPLGNHKPFRGKAIQRLPQGADPCPVDLPQAIQPELPARRQAAEEDVSAQAPVCRLADICVAHARVPARRLFRQGTFPIADSAWVDDIGRRSHGPQCQ